MTPDSGRPTPYCERIEIAGTDAPWITMVHGASQNRGIFSAQVEAFQDQYRLLLIDLPGHGGSSSMSGPYGQEEYAASVSAALDVADLGATHYWGTHTGAAVGLMLALRQPEKILSLVLDGAVIPSVDIPSTVEAYGRARSTVRTEGVPAAIAEWLELGPWFDTMRANPEQCRRDAHCALISEFTGAPWLDHSPPAPVAPVRPRLASIGCRVLLVNGEHDVADFMLIADELERTLPRVERARVPNAGGFPLWDQPDAVNERVRRFLEG